MLFASPWYLLGALGAAIPVLIHLFGRRRARRVLFPSLMLIKAAQRERTSFVRLRQVWLMILRALAILLLSLGLARPTVSWITTASNPETQTVFLLDDSLSMRSRVAGRSAFELARRTAEDLLKALPPRQMAAFAVTSAPLQTVQGTATKLLSLLNALQPSYAAVDIAHALGELGRSSRESTLPRHLYLLTDLQASGWLDQPGLRADDRVTIVDCGQDVSNHAATSLEVSEPPALPDRPVALLAAARHYGATTGPLSMRLRVGAGELPPQAVSVSAGRGTALFDWQPQRAGEVVVEAALPPDALREDDRHWQVVRVRDRVRVSLLGAPEKTQWVRLALAPEAEARVQLSTGPPGPQTDVVIAWTASEALRAFGDSGGGVLFFAGDLTQTAADALLGTVALTVGAFRILSAPVHLTTFDTFQVPLRAFANPAAGDLREPGFRTYREMTVTAQSSLQPLAAFEDGTPAFLRGHLGKGRLLIANFDPSEAGGDLVRQPVFVPLLHRLVGYLAQDAWPELDEALAGAEFALVSPASASDVECIGPEDRRCEVRVTPQHWLLRPDEPGVWRLQWKESGALRTRSLAINLDPRESDPTRLSPAAVVQCLRPAQAEVLPAAEALKSLHRSPLSLSTPLIALALLLLILELGLTRAGRAPRGGE
ncbi:MAG: vWA domain-containing protein [Armatimonadota bacterium]